MPRELRLGQPGMPASSMWPHNGQLGADKLLDRSLQLDRDGHAIVDEHWTQCNTSTTSDATSITSRARADVADERQPAAGRGARDGRQGHLARSLPPPDLALTDARCQRDNMPGVPAWISFRQ
ncbi:hypothetical protein ABLN79_00915 [Mycobacterium tuberculosis]